MKQTMKKILVIEDQAQTRSLYLKCLQAEGFNTIGAENGLIGVQRAQEQLPDVVICDITMPQLDGYGVLTTLRQNPLTAMIPFVFLTAKATKTEIRQGMDMGADDYLTKPSTVEELLGTIAARLEKQAALQQWYAAEGQQVKSQSTDTTKLPNQSIFPSCSHLNKVFQFIEDNYQEPINLYDVAQAVGYSPAYLTNLVKRQTDRTIHCWIVERRMADARSLLLETNQPVNQIAASVGYPDAGHFIRQFRKLYNLPPKVWRDTHRSQLAIHQHRLNSQINQKSFDNN